MENLVDFKIVASARAVPRAAEGRVFFDRRELRQLLGFYTTRVMTGEWRDYAIDLHAKATVFSVFRHTADVPLFAIAKLAQNDRKGRYILSAGPRILKRAHALGDLLDMLAAKPRLVWAR
jgi:hypothetical protein